MAEEYKSGEELSFNVYGVKVKGKYLFMKDSNVIVLECISDTSGASVQGEIIKLNKRFLVSEPVT